MSSETTTTVEKKGVNPAAALAAYICAAVGLVIILGITFYVVRKVRLRKAKKYIKQQSKRTIGMGPVLSDQPPPPSFWRWKEVKAGIKARRAGQPIPAVSRNVANGEASTSPGASRPTSASSLGQPRSKMHGDRVAQAGYSVKQERLKVRIEAKQAKREKKARQKEVKTILTQMLEDKINGTFTTSSQELPGDRFPTLDRQRMAGANNAPPTTITHVGPLRRDSVMAIPNTTYLIERTKGKRPATVHKSATSHSLEIPDNLHGLRNGGNYSSSSLSAMGYGSTRGNNGRNMQCEVTVHHVTDRNRDDEVQSVRSYDGKGTTTEL